MGRIKTESGIFNCCRKGCDNTCEDTKRNRITFSRLQDLEFGDNFGEGLKEHVLDMSKGEITEIFYSNGNIFIIII
jgi:hypothetical protein